MPRMVVDPRYTFDDGRHALQCPQVGWKPMCLSALEQLLLDPFKVCGVELPLTAKTPYSLQRLLAPTQPLPEPTAHALPAHPKNACDLRLFLFRLEQASSLSPSFLERQDTFSCTCCSSLSSFHAGIVTQPARFVTLFCEDQ